MHIALIVLLALFSIYKTFGFYFWHDDFSVLYQAVSKNCTLGWPYTSYCSLFSFLHDVFDLNALWYFGLGAVLFVFVCIVFYLFLKRLYDNKRALFTTSLLATSYLGLGVFYESYNSITLFASIGTYFLSLLFLYNGLTNSKRRLDCFYSLVIFSASILILQARSATYIFPYLAFIFLFSKNLRLSRKIILAVFSIVLYIIFFRVLGSSGSSMAGGISLLKFVVSTDVSTEFINFLQDLSLVIFTDFISRFFVLSQILKIITGLIILIAFLLYFFNTWRKKESSFKSVFLGLLIFLSFYLPFALRNDQPLNSNHRYLWPAFLGLLVIVPAFLKENVARIILIVLILVGLIQSNYYFGKFLSESRDRREFYRQLKDVLPQPKEGSIIFIGTSEVDSQKVADFLRVGNFPSEASIATHYGIRYQNFRLVTNGNELSKVLQQDNFDVSNLYVFYYNRGELTDNTSIVREYVTEGKYFYSVLNKNTSLEFKIDGFLGLVSSKLDIALAAYVPNFPLPFSKDCLNCKENADLPRIYSYLTAAKRLKGSLGVSVSNSWENTDAENLVDDDETTYWVADRPKWFEGEKPAIKLKFVRGSVISGVSLKSSFKSRKPIDFEVFVDGRKIMYIKAESEDWLNMAFDDMSVGEVEIKITSTLGSDTPTIEELAVSPGGYHGISFSDTLQVRSSPARFLRDELQKDAFINYAKSGITACIKWMTPGYQEGMKEFEIKADGKLRTYSIVIPSLGAEEATFKLGCINYPLEVNLLWARANFLGNNKH